MVIKNLSFPNDLAIYIWIRHQYNATQTEEEAVELYYDWLRLSEESSNHLKRIAFRFSANALYQELTNRSYQTKQFQKC